MGELMLRIRNASQRRRRLTFFGQHDRDHALGDRRSFDDTRDSLGADRGCTASYHGSTFTEVLS